MAATPRQNRRAHRLQAIKDAAMELVVRDGIEGFSVHKLAERVDLTAGALYRYFDSRDQMLIAVQAEVLAVFDRYLELVGQAQATRPILEQVVVMCRAYVALAELQPQRFQLNAQFIAAPTPVFDAEAVRGTTQRTLVMLARFASLIGQAQQEGSLRAGNTQHRAVLAWSSVHGLVERRKLERLAPDAFSQSALLDELLMTLLVGWGADLDTATAIVAQELSIDSLRDAMAAAQADVDEVE